MRVILRPDRSASSRQRCKSSIRAPGALALGQAYSRLVIDSNRKLTAHDSIATASDTIPVPGNADVSPEERDARYHQIMLPCQTRVGAELVALRAVGPVRIVSIRTCTKQLRGGTFRPWQVGVISGADERMRRPVFEHLQVAATGLLIGENEPYIVNMTNDYTLPVYAEAQGIPYVEFEFRNDMFGDDASREEICRVTAEALYHAVAELADDRHRSYE
jgi:predicted N-formylglutamate amidohydrolase